MATTRRPLITGNWKMHTTVPEARALAREILSALGPAPPFDVGFFPPAVSLAAVAAEIDASGRPALLGAQNMHHEEAGAFTGEISAAMILSTGARAVLIGHSERRHLFGETDDEVARKVGRALTEGLIPLVCVGEKIEERDAGRTVEVVGRQLAAAVAPAASAEALARVIIAYEPVWAIGTGRTATPEEAQEVHEFIRRELERVFESLGAPGDESDSVRVLYGGSVKPENARGLLEKPDIDGALVGGASLKAGSFLGICEGCVPGPGET